MQPGTVLIGHDWVLSTSRWGVQVLLGHVKKSDGSRGTFEISNGDTCFEQWYVHDLDKWQTMPTEYSFKRVHGAGDLIPRRFEIEVDITAATSRAREHDEMKVDVHVDSDWAEGPERKSTGGGMMIINGTGLRATMGTNTGGISG